MITMKSPKTSTHKEKYICEKCDFKCCKKGDWSRHITTQKHIKITKSTIMITNLHQIHPHMCHCGKEFAYRQNLYRHKKTCDVKEIANNGVDECKVKKEDPKKELDNSKNNIILKLLEQNNQLQQQIIDLCKEKSSTTINNTNSNNTFNLQIFLNETCKDAMNIMDFVESVQLKLTDLENVGKLGFIDGISNIIVSNLKALDISKRPLHCSDQKREILYIKDKNKWEKENEEKERLKMVIKHIAHKNIQMIPEWKEEHPEYIHDEGSTNDQYLKIIMESMNDSNTNCQNKIISNVAKTVIIDKSDK